MNPYVAIKSVRLTEKGTMQSDQFNQYTVVADRRANKQQIRNAVEELFKVTVLNINTMSVRGRLRRKRTAQQGRTPAWKKALVTLKAGESISLT